MTAVDGTADGQDRLRQRLRVAAYGVCVRDGQVLLARLLPSEHAEPSRWTMPGGGLEHGEDPLDAVVREVEEETGFRVRVERLLGIDSYRSSPSVRGDDFHGLRIVYEVRVIGGELRHEIDGSTDLAAWIGLDEVSELERVGLVDRALAFHRSALLSGRAGRP
ncbi:NUDIX hydrolase [Streptomyces meridianus]|uniref:NUDIX hydrolase n=1 Tax=Streptomyces meridianus TaxID=2938945 RepID=A0ABT0X502_9ACTN|nr:NUDIX hydrolase [Streptomyces meridianus]MCM2577617.1 NUDIX hydrolase [Streptomyces meridianus]